LASLTLAWDPVPGDTIAGYNVYYGSSSLNYTNFVSVPAPTVQATITGLEAGPVYFFATTAYNDLGLESDFSIELAASVPDLPVLSLSMSGTVATLTWLVSSPGWTAQASADLVTWTNLTPAVIQGSNFVITEPRTTAPVRFYRLIR
jgi:hypothetical protein